MSKNAPSTTLNLNFLGIGLGTTKPHPLLLIENLCQYKYPHFEGPISRLFAKWEPYLFGDGLIILRVPLSTILAIARSDVEATSHLLEMAHPSSYP